MGYYLDSDSGHFYVRARIYDPATGRWRSVDPIGFDGEDDNLYRYVLNNPANATDPYGLIVWRGPVKAPMPKPPSPQNDDSVPWYYDYWHYVNPFTTHYAVDAGDQCLQWGTRAGQGMAVVGASGATAIGTGVVEVNVLSAGNVIKVISRPLKAGWRMDPAHHGKPWGHMHWWRW